MRDPYFVALAALTALAWVGFFVALALASGDAGEALQRGVVP